MPYNNFFLVVALKPRMNTDIYIYIYIYMNFDNIVRVAQLANASYTL